MKQDWTSGYFYPAKSKPFKVSDLFLKIQLYDRNGAWNCGIYHAEEARWLSDCTPHCNAVIPGSNRPFPRQQQILSVPRWVVTWNGTVPWAGIWEVEEEQWCKKYIKSKKYIGRQKPTIAFLACPNFSEASDVAKVYRCTASAFITPNYYELNSFF